MGSKIERINNFISQKLTALDKTEITAVEMARYLDEVGILKDNRSRPGLPLRNFLRSGAIIGGYQTSTNRWLIKRSSESKKLISVSTAAQKLNLSEPAIYKKIKDNEINVRRMGQKRILIPENEIVRIRSKENEKIAKGEVENILNIREKLGKEMSFLKEEITFINHRILKMERILLSIENNEKISENHKIILNTNGNEYETLADILPEKPGLRVIFVAKRPSPVSVKIGHYFQGRQGKLFWSSLKRYGFFDVPIGIYEDDFLLKHKYGIVDIVKIP